MPVYLWVNFFLSLDLDCPCNVTWRKGVKHENDLEFCKKIHIPEPQS